MRALTKFYNGLIMVGECFQPVLLLLLRFFLGVAFFHAGWGKLQNIHAFEGFLASLGFPLPLAHAYFVASVEAFGGILLFIGLAGRLAGAILMINMIVAYLTAHHDAVVGLWNMPGLFVMEEAFLYLLTSALVFAFGPGYISVDGLLERFVFKGKKTRPPKSP